MKTLILFISLLGLTAWSKIETPPQPRTLTSLYKSMREDNEIYRVEAEPLKLPTYHLVVSSRTGWSGSAQADASLENLAAQFDPKVMRVIEVYDNDGQQDYAGIRTKSPKTKIYEYFDQNRVLYHWFKDRNPLEAVLVGPRNEILFSGYLNNAEALQKIRSLIKSKK